MRVLKESRSTALGELATLKKELALLENELAAYGDCDPTKIEEKRRAVFLAREAALRWTGQFVLRISGEFHSPYAFLR